MCLDTKYFVILILYNARRLSYIKEKTLICMDESNTCMHYLSMSFFIKLQAKAIFIAL